jgi:hypothetical protein
MVEKQEKCNYPQIPLSPDRTRSKGYFKSTWSRTRVSEMTICRPPDDCKGVGGSRYGPCLSLNSSSTQSKPSSISLPRLGRPVLGSQPITS